MDISVTQQAGVFLWSLLLGGGLGLFYDFFRILRLAIRWNSIWIFLQDLIFWLVCAFATFSFVFATNSGEIRWFVLFGALLGAVLYFTTLGILVMRSSRAIIGFIKRMLRALFRIILAPFHFLRMLLRPKRVIRRRNLKNTRKISKKYFKNSLKRDRMRRTVEKTENKKGSARRTHEKKKEAHRI